MILVFERRQITICHVMINLVSVSTTASITQEIKGRNAGASRVVNPRDRCLPTVLLGRIRPKSHVVMGPFVGVGLRHLALVLRIQEVSDDTIRTHKKFVTFLALGEGTIDFVFRRDPQFCHRRDYPCASHVQCSTFNTINFTHGMFREPMSRHVLRIILFPAHFALRVEIASAIFGEVDVLWHSCHSASACASHGRGLSLRLWSCPRRCRLPRLHCCGSGGSKLQLLWSNCQGR
jgi:hypothetical protein